MAGKKDRIKDSERSSIIAKDLTKCYICGSTDRVALHEAFYGNANRKKSKEDKMIFPICGPHHNLSSAGVHFNKELDLKLKKIAEKVWIANYTSKDENIEDRIDKFIKRYGKNYLDDEDLKNFSM